MNKRAILVTHNYFTELLRAHECFSRICPVDFDADGTLGRVFIDRSSCSSPQEYSLIVRENGRQLALLLAKFSRM
jgi:hypothetical protein